MSIVIEPYTETVSQSFDTLDIVNISVTLTKSAIITVRLYDTVSCVFKNKNLIMEGGDYELWSDNDQYVVEWVCKTLGITPIK